MSGIVIAVLLAALGIAFIAAEVFIPSFGVLTILAILSFVGGIIVAFGESYTIGMVFTISVLVVAPLVGLLLLKVFPKTSIGKSLILSSSKKEERPAYDGEEDYDHLLGKRGLTKTALRPSGVAIIANRRLDVVTTGVIIDPDTEVEVVEVEGNRVVVAPVSEIEGSNENQKS